jgi:hypothetical protein
LRTFFTETKASFGSPNIIWFVLSDCIVVCRGRPQDWLKYNENDPQGEVVSASERARRPEFAPLPPRYVLY